jgi:hypothetical protein
MAQKRIQYVKTATGVEKQLIASSADIVEVEKIEGLNATNVQDALEELSTIAAEGGVTSVNGKTGAVTLTKSDIELGNVTNDAQVKRSEMGVAGGVATLDTAGKVPSSQLPSYVDDIIEGHYNTKDGKFYENDGTNSQYRIVGETGKIYVDKNTEKTYRWSGTAYVEISASLALGTTSSTAFPGDRGVAVEDLADVLSENVDYLEQYSMDKIIAVSITPDSQNRWNSVEIKDTGVTHTSGIEFSFLHNNNERNTVAELGIDIPIVPGENVSFTTDENKRVVRINSTLPNTGVSAGTYSAVSVDEKGRVTAGSQIIEWGTSGQSVPSNNLAVGGLFFALVE